MTKKENRYCVIMCGGVGSRFWPYSRVAAPKQFIDFLGTGRSMLQMTFDRVSAFVPKENIIVATNKQYEQLIKQQLPEVVESQILFEPVRRNTAPCIAWAAYHINAINPDANMLVVPSDHLILRGDEFSKCVERGFEFVEQNEEALLTMAITPNRAETGYGYLQIEGTPTDGVQRVKTFTEKPNAELAKIFVDTGEFFWNSGMFMWSVGGIIKAMRSVASQITEYFDANLSDFGTANELACIESIFPSLQNISIDFAVMEKADNVFAQCVDLGWSDLGTWGALFENSPKSIAGNVTQNNKTLMFNSHNNVVAVKGDKLVVTSGLDNFIIADTDDVLFIVPREEEKKIKLYVNDVESAYGKKYL